MRLSGLSAVVFIVAGFQQAASGAIQWDVANGGNGHWYELVGDNITDVYSWTAADTTSRNLAYLGVQGHLLTITSAEEQFFIEQEFFPYYPAWIGLSFQHQGTGGDWAWVTGESVAYTNWYDLSHKINEDYATIGVSLGVTTQWGKNVNTDEGGQHPFIVEYDTPAVPEPTSLIVWSSLGAVGAAMALWRRRRAA
jgi:hypothetical protein